VFQNCATVKNPKGKISKVRRPLGQAKIIKSENAQMRNILNEMQSKIERMHTFRNLRLKASTDKIRDYASNKNNSQKYLL